MAWLVCPAACRALALFVLNDALALGYTLLVINRTVAPLRRPDIPTCPLTCDYPGNRI